MTGDGGLGGGDVAFGEVHGLAGLAEGGFDAEPVFAGGGGDAEVFLDLSFLADEVFGDGGECGVGGAEFLFLMGEPFVAGGDVVFVAVDEGGEFAFAFGVEADAVFSGVDEILAFVELVAKGSEEGFHFAEVGAFCGDIGFFVADAVFGFGLGGAEGGDAGVEGVAFRGEVAEFSGVEVGVEDEDILVEVLPAAGFGGLALAGAHLAFEFCEDVVDAEEIGFGVFEFAEGLAFFGFAFGDAGGFLEDLAAVFGFGAEEHVDFALLHDAVGAATDAGVHEELVDVLEAAGVAVEFVFAFAVAEDAAGDADLIEGDAEVFFAVVEDETDLGHAEGFAFIGAVEDYVGHFAAAEGFGGGFAEGPADPVDDVGFAAAVWADDGRDAFMEVDLRLIGEGFESVEFETFQAHILEILTISFPEREGLGE